MNLFKSVFFGLLVLISSCFVNADIVNAATVEINNQIGKPLFVSILHYSETENSWIAQGWWTVQGNSFRSIDFPNHIRPHIWVHMHNKDKSWGYEKAWTVISEKFRYKVSPNGSTCPQGTNRRQVTYNSYKIGQNGTVRVTAK